MLDQPQKMRANLQSGKLGGGQNDCLYAKKQTDKELQTFGSEDGRKRCEAARQEA